MADRKSLPSSVRIAEPVHRIGPLGVSSGVSLRDNDIPKSTVDGVRDICKISAALLHHFSIAVYNFNDMI
jgi:hypothetical protein